MGVIFLCVAVVVVFLFAHRKGEKSRCSWLEVGA